TTLKGRSMVFRSWWIHSALNMFEARSWISATASPAADSKFPIPTPAKAAAAASPLPPRAKSAGPQKFGEVQLKGAIKHFRIVAVPGRHRRVECFENGLDLFGSRREETASKLLVKVVRLPRGQERPGRVPAGVHPELLTNGPGPCGVALALIGWMGAGC